MLDVIREARASREPIAARDMLEELCYSVARIDRALRSYPEMIGARIDLELGDQEQAPAMIRDILRDPIGSWTLRHRRDGLENLIFARGPRSIAVAFVNETTREQFDTYFSQYVDADTLSDREGTRSLCHSIARLYADLFVPIAHLREIRAQEGA